MLDSIFSFSSELSSTRLSISDYNAAINQLLSSSILNIYGEISELNNWQNKYTYIILKDTNVDTVTTSAFGIIYQISNIHDFKVGDIVLLTGSPGLHTKSGRHSFQIKKIEKIDEGLHNKSREELIKKLENEGVINPQRKRPILRTYNKIALITAVPSQAYNDFIKIYNNRWGQGRIEIYKAQMQGINAYKSILLILDSINTSDNNYDCIVIARGGGSKEDLINFDSEELVRKVFSIKFPVISAIGHEGDVSILDLVADLRASTPSNAAELLTTPDKSAIISKYQSILRNIHENLLREIDYKQEVVNHSYRNIQNALKAKLEKISMYIENKERFFNALDIESVLERGFSIISDNDGNTIRQHTELLEEKIYNIYLSDKNSEKYTIRRNSK